ncbi:hypothetical protein HY632_03805 [Candidatus Uhrbacteria bacterium]|nr:hypothetical protein [Candidatus Uhrbacteria bacterium]
MWLLGTSMLAGLAVAGEIMSAWVPVLWSIPWLVIATVGLLCLRPYLPGVLPGVLMGALVSDALWGEPWGIRACVWIAGCAVAIPMIRRWAYERRAMHLIGVAWVLVGADRFLLPLLHASHVRAAMVALAPWAALSACWAAVSVFLFLRFLPRQWVFPK